MKQHRYNYRFACGLAAAMICAPATVFSQQTPAVKAAPATKAAPPTKAAPAKKAAPPTKAAPKVAVKGPPRGPIEKYDCKIGTEDQHARLALLAQGGEVQSVAYYSKWKPRTCSVHLERNDAFSKWKDSGDATVITTDHGDFLIQVSRSEYQLFFREVDRMHYCGMMGKLNGSMTVTRGPKRQCSVVGIMDRNETEALNEKEETSNTAGIPSDTFPKPQSTD